MELQDETQRISTVRPFTTMLKVVEKKGNKAEKILNAQISQLIGKGNDTDISHFNRLEDSTSTQILHSVRNKAAKATNLCLNPKVEVITEYIITLKQYLFRFTRI